MELGESGLVAVGEYPSLPQAQEHALVVLAMNLSCWLGRAPTEGYLLLAEAGRAERIRNELAAYDAEQASAREAPGEVELPTFSNGAWLALAWATALLFCFILQGRIPGWERAGVSDNLALIDRGEWWRPFTAMFLHGDLGHLAGNLVAGIAYSILACKSLGRALAWICGLSAGTLANILTALIYYPQAFRSLGASTTVFGFLGVLSGYGFYVAFRQPASAPWRAVAIPLGGGLALLGWFGTAGENTDLIGHFCGFACGLVIGVAASAWRLRGRFRSIEKGKNSN